jgi:cell volume regulation protein A
LRHGDQLLIVATAETRTATEDRVRQVSGQGRLAGWSPRPGDAIRDPRKWNRVHFLHWHRSS